MPVAGTCRTTSTHAGRVRGQRGHDAADRHDVTGGRADDDGDGLVGHRDTSQGNAHPVRSERACHPARVWQADGMPPVRPPSTPGPTGSPDSPGFPEGLEPMRGGLDAFAAAADPASAVSVLVAELETAYEALRVADEEVRSQQDHIAELLDRENLLRGQHERMLAVLPVPVLTTDRLGVVRAVNAAAAGPFARRAAHLVGKSLLTLVAAEDRPHLRRFLDGAREDGPGLRRVVSLVHRDATVESVELQATVLPGAAQVSWLVLRSHDPDAAEHAAHRLAPTMVELIGLPSRAGTDAVVRDVREVMHEAARTCAEALGPGCAVSVTLGPPLEPEAVATSDERAQACDGAQAAAGDGPCHAA